MSPARARSLSSAGVLLLTVSFVLLIAALAAVRAPLDAAQAADAATTVTVLTDQDRAPGPSTDTRADQPVQLPDPAVAVAAAPPPTPPLTPAEDAEPAPEPEPEPSEPAPPAAPTGPTRTDAGALLVAATGSTTDPISTGGKTVRYSVEVEHGTGLDPDEVAAVVEEALYDERSWARDVELVRVAPADASLHVVVAAPATVDAMCARVGLRTGGWLSCWTERTAAINLDRWLHGTRHHDDVELYRRYVVNHEVGHGLGHGHASCGGRGELAPVMQQQTKGLEGCAPNPWPYP